MSSLAFIDKQMLQDLTKISKHTWRPGARSRRITNGVPPVKDYRIERHDRSPPAPHCLFSLAASLADICSTLTLVTPI